MRCLTLLLLPLLGAASAPAAEICGYVYSIRGDWRLAPQFAVTLKPGMELHTGDRIKLMTPARPAHINAGLLNGSLWKQDCDTDADCGEALALPGLAPGATLSERLRNLIAGFGSHPTPVVFTLSRGGGGQPREAVLPLRGGKADLSPALRSITATRVSLRLIPVGASTPAASVICTLPGQPCAAPAPSPGLYQLEVRAGEGEPQAVLVLIAAEADYPRLNSTFADAVRVAESWGAGAHPDARHYFLSASLEALHRTAGKAN